MPINYNSYSVNELKNEMETNGWVRIDSALEEEFIQKLTNELESIYPSRRQLMIKNGINVNTDGTSHHLLSKNSGFMELLSRMYFDDYLMDYFEGNYILNSFGGVINIKGSSAYVGNMHRDVRSFVKDIHLMCNMLIMLDDFTLDNGATHVLNGSHLKAEKPDENKFFAESDRITGQKGSIVLFDSNLWHATGKNKTDKPRRALTLTFTRPFIKQQMDYPRMLGYDYAKKISESLKQVIGYNSRVPASLDEWYQPPEKRMYKPGQG